MKRSVIIELNNAQQRQMGYVTVMSYAYCNLCVKADASSLLGVEVAMSGMPLHIEDMADVYVHTLKEDGDETIIDLFPKEANYLSLLAQGVFKAHPEMKQSIETYPDASEEDKDDPNAKFLRLTMPEVDKNRRDVLMQAIDALDEKCKLQLEVVKNKTTAKLTALGVKPIPKEAVQSVAAANLSALGAAPLPKGKEDPKKKEEEDPLAKLEEQHAQYDQMRDSLTNDKKKDVEDAYQQYLQHQEQAGSAPAGKKEQEGGVLSNIGQQLKMD